MNINSYYNFSQNITRNRNPVKQTIPLNRNSAIFGLSKDTVSFKAGIQAKKLTEEIKNSENYEKSTMSLNEAIGILEYFGFVQLDTEGSHIQFEAPYGGRYTIKKKNPVDKGCANAIILGIKQADEFDGELILKNGALTDPEKEKYTLTIQTAKDNNVLTSNKYKTEFMPKINEKKALRLENLKKALLVVFDNIYTLKSNINVEFDEKKETIDYLYDIYRKKSLEIPVKLNSDINTEFNKIENELKNKEILLKQFIKTFDELKPDELTETQINGIKGFISETNQYKPDFSRLDFLIEELYADCDKKEQEHALAIKNEEEKEFALLLIQERKEEENKLRCEIKEKLTGCEMILKQLKTKSDNLNNQISELSKYFANDNVVNSVIALHDEIENDLNLSMKKFNNKKIIRLENKRLDNLNIIKEDLEKIRTNAEEVISVKLQQLEEAVNKETSCIDDYYEKSKKAHSQKQLKRFSNPFIQKEEKKKAAEETKNSTQITESKSIKTPINQEVLTVKDLSKEEFNAIKNEILMYAPRLKDGEFDKVLNQLRTENQELKELITEECPLERKIELLEKFWKKFDENNMTKYTNSVTRYCEIYHSRQHL